MTTDELNPDPSRRESVPGRRPSPSGGNPRTHRQNDGMERAEAF
jgi:hypothetical protein